MAQARDGTHGIVDPAAGFEHFSLVRFPPSADLAWAVDRFWIVGWDLRGKAPYEQRVLPHPAVHLVFEAGRADIQAISRFEFVRRLEGSGQVLGVKFRPAGFRPFLGRAVSTIAGQRFAAAAVFGTRIDEMARTVWASDDLEACIPAVEGLLRGSDVAPLQMTAGVNAIVGHIRRDRSIVRVDDLAACLAITTRRLQRLLADHVGLGPKWVINRFRIHEAAEVAAGNSTVDWAQLAVELGYSDQSHLVRQFTSAVGSSPGRYARQTAR